ncbi:MAG: branched-chain amino acid transaminase [Chloroflexi bacterium]|nr:branched-chain amino acid transaminase [Chloroflexota bacterium]
MTPAAYQPIPPYLPPLFNSLRQRQPAAARPRAIKSTLVWMDGQMIPFDQANVHFLSPTLHYGASVFEGIRCYDTPRGPAVFRLREHMARFLQSSEALGMDDPRYTLEQLCQAVFWLIEGNGLSDCYVRPLLFFGGSMGLDLDDYEPVVSIAVWPWEPFLGQYALDHGVRVMVSSYTRMNNNAQLTKAKIGGQYVNSILAKTSAKRSGFDEAIMLDQDGFVAECTGENLFLVRDGVLYTPPRANVLEGITRDSVMTLARDAGYKVVETRITRDELLTADELFVCGTAAEVAGVCAVDGLSVGSGQVGPVTRQVQEMYFDTVRGRNRRSLQWLEYVTTHPII